MQGLKNNIISSAHFTGKSSINYLRDGIENNQYCVLAGKDGSFMNFIDRLHPKFAAKSSIKTWRCYLIKLAALLYKLAQGSVIDRLLKSINQF